MKQLLIRADDLGFSEGVNFGIEKTVNGGLVKSVGLMPNMDAAPHGVRLLHDTTVCIGQHTNICTGRPLTDPSRIPSICQENGDFKPSSAYRNAFKQGQDFVVLEEVILEIEAQYQRFRELVGREPEYFEGHAVASDNFFRGLEIVAQRHGLPYLAMAPGKATAFRNTQVFSYILSQADVFITHAGMGGTGEAIYYGVPMIAIPQMDEQAITARQIEKLGLGFAFCDKNAITSEALRTAIISCLENPSYKQTVQEFSRDMKSLGGAKASAEALLRYLNK